MKLATMNETEPFHVSTCTQVPAFVPFTALPPHWRGKWVKIVLCEKPSIPCKEPAPVTEELDLPWD